MNARHEPHLLLCVAISVAVTATIMLAACGSGGNGSIALRDYQQQANTICAPAIDEMNSLIEPVIETTLAILGAEPFDPTQLQHFYAALTEPTLAAGAVVDDMLAALRDLPSPAERADEYTELWTDIDTTMDQARADITAAAADPDSATELWNIETSPFTYIDAHARQLKVPACALDR